MKVCFLSTGIINANSMKIRAKTKPPNALSMILSLNSSIFIKKIIAYIRLKISLFLFFYPLFAWEPQNMTLDAIYANDRYLFHKAKQEFICVPYGVWTLDHVLRKKGLGAVCKKALEDFIVDNPKLHYFAYYKMHLWQSYRVEFKKGACIIYMGSKQTLSETLLASGVAIKKPFFDDEEFRYRFNQASSLAKNFKRGVWSDAKLRSCMSEFFKE